MQNINIFGRHIDVNEQNKEISVCRNAYADELCFLLNRFADNGVDLSTLNCYIKTLNSDNQSDVIIPQTVVTDDSIAVKWVVSSASTIKDGAIKVQLLFEKTVDTQTTVWQTDVAEFNICGSLDSEDEIAESSPSLFQQWETNANNIMSQMTSTAESTFQNVAATIGSSLSEMNIIQSQMNVNAEAVSADRQAVEDAKASVQADTEASAENLADITEIISVANTAYSPSMISSKSGKIIKQKFNSGIGYKKLDLTGKTKLTLSNPSAAQSPDNPAVISGISGNIGFNLLSENLCYFDKTITLVNGIQISYDDTTGEITLNGTVAADGTIVLNSTSTKIFIPSGTSGRFKITEVSGTISISQYATGTINHDSTFLTSMMFTRSKVTDAVLFTASKDCLVRGATIWLAKGTILNNYKIKLCLSLDTVSGFPLSKLNNYTLSVPSPLYSVDVDCDRIDIVNKNYVKNINMRTLSQDEEYSVTEIDGSYCSVDFLISDAASNSKISSDKFSSDTSCEEYILFYQGRGYIKIKTSRLATANQAGFKQWLNSNPVNVMYKLSQPQISSFAAPTVVNSKNISVITADNISGIGFDVEYVKDTQAVIDSLTAAIIALGGSVNV